MVDYIKNLIKEKKITLNKLENELGLSQGSIRHWDEKPPSYDKIQKVANYFGITIDELVGNTEPKDPKQVKLINDYLDSDQRGKENIIRLADYEAQRTRASIKELKPFA